MVQGDLGGKSYQMVNLMSGAVNSMTGFAALKGQTGAYSWGWDIRSVNGKGLDLRLRVPDWIDGLESAVRGAVTAAVTRGNISLALRVQREDALVPLRVNPTQLARVMEALAEIEEAAHVAHVSLSGTSAAEVLTIRGVLETTVAEDEDTGPLLAALLADLPVLLSEFNAMRAAEGAALRSVLLDQMAMIERLTAQAAAAAEARKPQVAEALRTNLARVLDNSDGADPARVSQELAMLAVKADVTEEIDRLGAHIKAARDLLAANGAIGRKLDFMTQEFNREANTLCSKAASTDLTRIGLDLKAVIDQMREQVQNVE
jgi:uncharacterized protein (TIGR00255 family)